MTGEDPTLSFDQLQVLEILYNVEDPEIGINVVDLGLVRDLKVSDDVTEVTMTLTSPACPLTEEIEAEVADQVMTAGISRDVTFTWSFLPPWSMAEVTAQGRAELRALGF
jgi:metal-sulfur cluster biosynthetic enzyme